MNPTTSAPHGRNGDARAQNVKLSELASFFIGFPMPEARKATRDKVFLLEARSIVDGVILSPLPQAVISNLPQQQLLQAGDVILAAKDDGGYLALPLPAPAAPTVAGAPLWVIRIHEQARVHAAYLAWYLQTRPAQKLLCCVAGQGDADECTEEGLHCLHLPVPDGATQLAIVAKAAQCKQSEARAQALWQQLARNNEACLLAMAEGGEALD